MATPHGLAQDHTMATFRGAAKDKWTKGKEWLHRKANKVLDNLMYFQAFDITGEVQIAGEICLKANDSWGNAVTMNNVKSMIKYNGLGGRNVPIKFTGTMTTLFDGTTPAALCYKDSPNKVTIVLSKSKSNRDCALKTIMGLNGGTIIAPLNFKEIAV